MIGIIRYTILTAKRDYLFIGLVTAIIIACSLSLFLSSTALLEAEQMKIVYTAASSRMIIMIGLMTFIAFYIRRLFENREIEMVLSRAISRKIVVLSYFVSMSILSIIIILPVVILLLICGSLNPGGFAAFIVSLYLEAQIVIVLSLFFALILESAVLSLLISLGSYILARLVGSFIVFINFKYTFLNAMHGSVSYYISQIILKIISVIIPRLDLFSKTKWLIYGINASAIYAVAIQSLIYIPFILFATIYDFNKKQF